MPGMPRPHGELLVSSWHPPLFVCCINNQGCALTWPTVVTFFCSLDILIEDMVGDGGLSIPVLHVIDNGLGMNHEEIVKMLSFGHKRPKESDAEQIGHFGVGFKV